MIKGFQINVAKGNKLCLTCHYAVPAYPLGCKISTGDWANLWPNSKKLIRSPRWFKQHWWGICFDINRALQEGVVDGSSSLDDMDYVIGDDIVLTFYGLDSTVETILRFPISWWAEKHQDLKDQIERATRNILDLSTGYV